MELHDIQRAITRLEAIPRLSYGHYPTPIEELSRLRAELAKDTGRMGPRLLIKRDDYTGLGFGGNKVRKLEYFLAPAANNGIEVVITTGGEKSNHARVTAALCAKLGLRCILVLNPVKSAANSSQLKPASLHLDEMVSAEIHRVNCREERKPTAATIAEKLRREGKGVAEVPLGASAPVGALGYVRAIQEAAPQLKALDARPNYIFHASSSGGTQAGIIAGCQLFGLSSTQVIGVSADESADALTATVAEIINGVGELLELPSRTLRDQVTVFDHYIGPGYGLDTPKSVEAMKLLARAEGIILDPVYTAKAMAALLDWVRQGRLTEKDTVLFWHTGGQLAMFYVPV